MCVLARCAFDFCTSGIFIKLTMEKIYPLDSMKTSNPLDVMGYFDDYQQLISEVSLAQPRSSRQTSLLNLIHDELNAFAKCYFSFEVIEKLDKICRIDVLLKDELSESKDMSQPLTNTSFKTSANSLATNNYKLETLRYSETLTKRRNCKHDIQNVKNPIQLQPDKSRYTLLTDIKPGMEIIYSVLIYKPFFIKFNSKHTSRDLVIDKTMEVLGSIKLEEIVDEIHCNADKLVLKEANSVDIDISKYTNAIEKYPSKFFFIDGVFYNDIRSTHATDYSTPIIKWAQSKEILQFRTDSISETRLDSIKLILGFPQVFKHQGECEHLIVFTDVRLTQPSDCLYSKMYPRIVESSRTGNILCFLCNLKLATWFCKNCDRFPQEKVFLCTLCCKLYNFKDNEKVGNFNMYPYYNIIYHGPYF